jgi:hypothetical protein
MIWRLETYESLSCSILDDIRGVVANSANAANSTNSATEVQEGAIQ